MLWSYWHIITRQLSAFHKLIKCGSANINTTYSVPNYFYQMRMLTEAHLLTSCICTHGNILHSLLKITLKQFMYCQMSIVSYQMHFWWFIELVYCIFVIMDACYIILSNTSTLTGPKDSFRLYLCIAVFIFTGLVLVIFDLH